MCTERWAARKDAEGGRGRPLRPMAERTQLCVAWLSLKRGWLLPVSRKVGHVIRMGECRRFCVPVAVVGHGKVLLV